MALFSIKSVFDVRISPDGNYKTVGEGNNVEEALSYVPYQQHVQCLCFKLFRIHLINLSSLFLAGITPVIPGVNIPLSHLPLFMFVLVVAGVIHELGHALAAINANVRVTGFGIFLYAIYPGAFTEIDTEELGTFIRKSFIIHYFSLFQSVQHLLKNFEFTVLGYGIILS